MLVFCPKTKQNKKLGFQPIMSKNLPETTYKVDGSQVITYSTHPTPPATLVCLIHVG